MRRTGVASVELAGLPAVPGWKVLARRGEGASSVVWGAERVDDGALGALKVARDSAAARQAVSREAGLLARVARRWGPALLEAGPGFLVTAWTDAVALALPAAREERERLVAIVAHAVGRALEELHEAGVRHGDVKPDNVLLHAAPPRRDTPSERGATLIDLGLADDVREPARGGTPRYAAPELRERGEAGPAADLWALGMLLAEILDPDVARAADAHAAIVAWRRDGEPARWIEALLATAPGGRPSAGWVASRAARWLELAPDADASRQRRVDRVRRAYLAARAEEIDACASVSAEVPAPARTWIEESLAWRARLGDGAARGAILAPVGAFAWAQCLVRLVGPSVAAWPLPSPTVTEGRIGRLVELARERDPSSLTYQDVFGAGPVATRQRMVGSDEQVLVRLVRELARPAPAPEALDVAEDEIAAGRFGTLAVPLASALLRAGETGRAWSALRASDGPESDALRA